MPTFPIFSSWAPPKTIPLGFSHANFYKFFIFDTSRHDIMNFVTTFLCVLLRTYFLTLFVDRLYDGRVVALLAKQATKNSASPSHPPRVGAQPERHSAVAVDLRTVVLLARQHGSGKGEEKSARAWCKQVRQSVRHCAMRMRCECFWSKRRQCAS